MDAPICKKHNKPRSVWVSAKGPRGGGLPVVVCPDCAKERESAQAKPAAKAAAKPAVKPATEAKPTTEPARKSFGRRLGLIR
jgi:hypothetical protein